MRELVNLMNELGLNSTGLTATDVVVHIVQLDYGMKVPCLNSFGSMCGEPHFPQDENPIDRVRFYEKGRPDVAHKIRKTQGCPFVKHACGQHSHVRVYSNR